MQWFNCMIHITCCGQRAFIAEPLGKASNLDASLTVHLYVHIYIRSIYILTPQLHKSIYIYMYIRNIYIRIPRSVAQ